jgi:hypothetical protein
MAGQPDAVIVASGGDEDIGPEPSSQRSRKLSTKARQNRENQEAALDQPSVPKRQSGRNRTATNNGADGEQNAPAAGGGDVGEIQALQKQIREQTEILKLLLGKQGIQEVGLQAIKEELASVREELALAKEENKKLHDRIDDLTALVSIQSSPRQSYAEVARTPPTSQPSNVQTLPSLNSTTSRLTDTLYCTIDTSRAEEGSDQVSPAAIRMLVESGVRGERENASWRCRAVTKDPSNPHRVRIACRDEEEHKMVKRMVEAKLVRGARILRDDIFPIRVDSVNRTAVLDEEGDVRAGAAEAFGKENDTEIAKIAWLSNKNVPKAYGSMVVYLNKRGEAHRFLKDGFFYAGGESGYTKAFERRNRPKQCYNCQEITNHKAHQCNKAQVCGKCAKEGHRHTECTETILKCVPCGGPHESFSRNCRLLYPPHHG